MDCVRLICASASSLLVVANIFFREDRNNERVLLLRSLALWAWRIRFFEDASLGKGFTSFGIVEIWSAQSNNSRAFAQPIFRILRIATRHRKRPLL